MQSASKNVDPASLTISNQPRGNETLVTRLTGRTLQSLGLKCVQLPPLPAPFLIIAPDMAISYL